MASKQELLDSIKPDMRLDRAFFMKIYGYEISFPGFAQEAIWKLRELGCLRAEEYYNRFVCEYEKEHEKAMQNVAGWYRQQCETDNKNKERKAVKECQERKQREAKQRKVQQWSELSEKLNFH